MSHKILCIDDETHNLEALERLLRKKYKTICVSSGEEALDQLEEHNFSLIISDQKMPEMTGVEFFMKAKKIQPEAIRILLTGYTDLESVIDAINQGQIYRYITKPWDPDELLAITAQALEVFDMKGTIARQNKELQQANEQLQSLDKLKTDFMLLVNHELKTPLTGIFSFVQLLKEEKLNNEQALYLEKIAKNTKRLEDLINDTLLITRIKADTELDIKEQLDITALIKGQWQSLNQEHEKKKLKLKFNDENNFYQSANEKYITIVFKKLLHNCFSHAKPDSTVQLFLEEDPSQWKIKVINDVSNPVTKDLEQLMTAFSTNTPILNHAGGTGLGLSVIQAVVNLWQGQINIDTAGKKFVIEVSFPIAK